MKPFKFFLPLTMVAVVGAGAFTAYNLTPQKAFAKSTKIGAPKVAKPGQETATFAAGCFWSLEAMFEQLKGVSSVEPGYAGGTLENPTYEQVGEGDTGHAETVNIIFDPKVISYRDLLYVLFIIHDPTTKDQQGPDIGSQYRSVIFARTPQQKQDAQDAIKAITAKRIWNAPIVTEIAPYSTFYRAEDYHLDYYNLNPMEDYCTAVIAPKISKFRTRFKDELK